MKIQTNSGVVEVSKRSHYGKWLQGQIDGGAWTGWYTLERAWEYAIAAGKPEGCSWYAYGYLMAREQKKGAALTRIDETVTNPDRGQQETNHDGGD